MATSPPQKSADKAPQFASDSEGSDRLEEIFGNVRTPVRAPTRRLQRRVTTSQSPKYRVHRPERHSEPLGSVATTSRSPSHPIRPTRQPQPETASRKPPGTQRTASKTTQIVFSSDSETSGEDLDKLWSRLSAVEGKQMLSAAPSKGVTSQGQNIEQSSEDTWEGQDPLSSITDAPDLKFTELGPASARRDERTRVGAAEAATSAQVGSGLITDVSHRLESRLGSGMATNENFKSRPDGSSAQRLASNTPGLSTDLKHMGISTEHTTRLSERLQTAQVDLALGIMAQNLSSQDPVWVSTFAQDVLQAAETFRSGKTLDPDSRAIFEPLARSGGFRNPPEDQVSQRMIQVNSEILLEKVSRQKAVLDLHKAVRQHISTAEFLFRLHPIEETTQAKEYLTDLRDMYEHWTATSMDGTGENQTLLGELTHGAWSNMRDSMWRLMDSPICEAFNSLADETNDTVGESGGTAEAPCYTNEDRRLLQQTAMDHAVIMLGSVLSRYEEEAKDSDTPHSFTRISESLCQLRSRWMSDEWHEQGMEQALRQVRSIFENKCGTTVLGRRYKTLNSAESETESLNAMISQNFRVLSMTRRGQAFRGDWRRLTRQLYLNTRYLRDIAIKQGPVPEIVTLSQCLQALGGLSPYKDSVEQFVNTLMGSEGRVLYDFVGRHLPEDWTKSRDSGTPSADHDS